jgi:PLP dependent protein
VNSVCKSIEDLKASTKQNPVDIIAVSKQQPAELIKLAIDSGLLDFAENNISETIAKQSIISLPTITWHYVGPMQSNKCRDIAATYDWVQSISTDKQAMKLNKECLKIDEKINVLVQVNISENIGQSGCGAENTEAMLRGFNELKALKLRGLMCIASKENPEEDFKKMHSLYLKLKTTYNLDTLSMGMSNDYKLAIKYGATQIRVGKAIFGESENV